MIVEGAFALLSLPEALRTGPREAARHIRRTFCRTSRAPHREGAAPWIGFPSLEARFRGEKPDFLRRSRGLRLAARRSFMRATLPALVASVLLGCLATSSMGCSSPGGSGDPSSKVNGSSSGGAAANGDDSSPEITSDTTWNNGKQINAPVVIDANSTVTIAAGATITAAAGVQITVKGTLKTAGGAQAKLTGTDVWTGIVVASGGTVTLDGVDFENAAAPIDVQDGAKLATYSNGTATAAKAPFVVEHGGKLTASHVTVKASTGTSHVQGELHASYLDYDSNGHDGITAEHDDAIVWVEDSEMHGDQGVTDMFVSYQGASLIHVAYTEITHVHCAFHIERIKSLDVSHVTATSDYDGFMLYGSLNDGTRTVTQSNIHDELHAGVEEAATTINGAITFTDNYFANNGSGDTLLHASSAIHVTQNATTPFADAKPR
jgi:hypothetical protein